MKKAWQYPFYHQPIYSCVFSFTFFKNMYGIWILCDISHQTAQYEQQTVENWIVSTFNLDGCLCVNKIFHNIFSETKTKHKLGHITRSDSFWVTIFFHHLVKKWHYYSLTFSIDSPFDGCLAIDFFSCFCLYPFEHTVLYVSFYT